MPCFDHSIWWVQMLELLIVQLRRWRYMSHYSLRNIEIRVRIVKTPTEIDVAQRGACKQSWSICCYSQQHIGQASDTWGGGDCPNVQSPMNKVFENFCAQAYSRRAATWYFLWALSFVPPYFVTVCAECLSLSLERNGWELLLHLFLSTCFYWPGISRKGQIWRSAPLSWDSSISESRKVFCIHLTYGGWWMMHFP
jgi:hypothetical protein